MEREPHVLTHLHVGAAFALAAQVHRHQKCEDGDAYILHPARLAVQFSDPLDQIVAILHDVIENTYITPSMLRSDVNVPGGFGEEVIDAVLALTKGKGEDYFEAMARVAKNACATRVKLKDLEDNINLLRLKTVSEKDLRRAQKYHQAHKFLTAAQREPIAEAV